MDTASEYIVSMHHITKHFPGVLANDGIDFDVRKGEIHRARVAVLECLEQNGIGGINAKRLGIPDEFVEHGSQEKLRDKYGLNEQGIYESVKEFLAAHNPKKGLPKFVKIK